MLAVESFELFDFVRAIMKNAAVFKPSCMRNVSLLPILFSERTLIQSESSANKFVRNEIHEKNTARMRRESP